MMNEVSAVITEYLPRVSNADKITTYNTARKPENPPGKDHLVFLNCSGVLDPTIYNAELGHWSTSCTSS